MPNPKQKKLTLLINLFALLPWLWAAPCLSAGVGIDLTLNATLVDNTCQVSIPDDGLVHLPTVSKFWFYNADGSSRLQPTDTASGTLFTVRVESCVGDSAAIKTIDFSFQPQTKQWPAASRQVFINETSVAEGGAANTGAVIFSQDLNSNVLNSDGTSSVILAAGTEGGTKEYSFYARLQNTGTVQAGKVTSRVIVSATYN